MISIRKYLKNEYDDNQSDLLFFQYDIEGLFHLLAAGIYQDE